MTYDALLEELRALRAELETLRSDEPREALRRSEANLRNAQRIAHIGSWDWNLETGALEWSDENYRIFRMRPGSAMDYELFLDFVHPEDREKLEQTVARAFRTQEPFQLDYRIIAKGGDVRHLSGQGEVEFDADNRPVRLSGTAQDRTEQRQIEATLADYQDHPSSWSRSAPPSCSSPSRSFAKPTASRLSARSRRASHTRSTTRSP